MDRAGEGLALDDDGDVDGDLLATAHDDEVDVLDDLAHRVALDVLDEGELGRTLDVEVDDRVGGTDEQHRLVAREGDVLRLGAVAVDDRGDLVGGAELARSALAELGAGLRCELGVVGHGGASWCRGRRRGAGIGGSVVLQLERVRA